MKISPDGTTVSFKTEPEELFLAEKSGDKPNTVRILDALEADFIKREPPTKIIIQYQQEIFQRTITNISGGVIYGKDIVIFSWTNEEHHHTIFNNTGRDPCAHTMSFDEVAAETCPATEQPSLDHNFVAIGISKQMFNTLRNRFSGRTMNSVIQELYETFLYKLLHRCLLTVPNIINTNT